MADEDKKTRSSRRPRKLTGKQRVLIKGIAEGKMVKDAAKEADLHPNYASELLTKPEIKKTLVELMDEYGLGDKDLLAKHNELIQAEEKTVSAQALKMAYQLKGAFVDKKEVTFPDGIEVKIRFVKPNGS